jgi:hypothetical protein
MLALHSQGKGERDAAAFAGMMNLALCHLSNCWEKMEEELCVSIIAIITQIVEENLEEEINLTEGAGSVTYHQGKVGIYVQVDARWDQRSSGQKYDSDSGTALICGNLSGKCVGMECMIRRSSAKQKNYSIFSKDTNPCQMQILQIKTSKASLPPQLCWIFERYGSEGSFQNCKPSKHNNILTYVMDDDSSTKAILRHGLAAMVASGAMLDADWPKTAGGLE